MIFFRKKSIPSIPSMKFFVGTENDFSGDF